MRRWGFPILGLKKKQFINLSKILKSLKCIFRKTSQRNNYLKDMATLCALSWMISQTGNWLEESLLSNNQVSICTSNPLSIMTMPMKMLMFSKDLQSLAKDQMFKINLIWNWMNKHWKSLKMLLLIIWIRSNYLIYWMLNRMMNLCL